MVREIQYMSPADIKFTQDSISHEFGGAGGESLEVTFKELLYGIKTVHDIQNLAAVEEDGLLWVVSGNRRLYLYKRLQRHGIVNNVPVVIIPKNPEKFAKMKTTINDGVKVKIRSDRHFPNGQKLSDRLDRIYAEWYRGAGRSTVAVNQGNTGNVRPPATQAQPAPSTHASRSRSVPRSGQTTRSDPVQLSNPARRSHSSSRSIEVRHSVSDQDSNPIPRSTSAQRSDFYDIHNYLATQRTSERSTNRSITNSRPQSVTSRGRSNFNEASTKPLPSRTENQRHSRSNRNDYNCCCTIL